jgi:hypothetical protein
MKKFLKIISVPSVQTQLGGNASLEGGGTPRISAIGSPGIKMFQNLFTIDFFKHHLADIVSNGIVNTQDELGKFYEFQRHKRGLATDMATYMEIDHFDLSLVELQNRELSLEQESIEKIEELLNLMFNQFIPRFWIHNPYVFSLTVFKEEKANYLVNSVIDTVLNTLKVIPFPVDFATEKVSNDYQSMQDRLIRDDHPAKDRFNVRKDSLFKWCFTMINTLVYSPLNTFLVGSDIDIEKKLAITGTLMAIFDTRIDDLADNIRDGHLVGLFAQIPHLKEAPPSELAAIQLELDSYSNGIFRAYFEETVELFREIEDLIHSFTCSVDSRHLQRMGTHLDELMGVFNYAVTINTNATQGRSECILDDFETMVEKLAPNMMTKLLFDIQLAALEKYGSEDIKVFICKNESDLLKLFDLIEKAFHLSNCFATFEREIDEGDITNSVFKRASDLCHAEFEVAYKKAGRAFQYYVEKETHLKFSEDCVIRCFDDLLVANEEDQPTDFALKKKATKLLVSKDNVIKSYFDNWEAFHSQICAITDKLIQNLGEDETPFSKTLKKALQSYSINTELFLVQYVIASNIKGMV